jgi:hypothetical protein
VKELLIYPLVSGSPYGLDLCFDVGGANNNNNPILPDLVFHFTDADFFLTIENVYTSLVDTTSPVNCLAIVPATIIGFSILGNVQQQDHLIVFDLEKLQMDDEIHHCA